MEQSVSIKRRMKKLTIEIVIGICTIGMVTGCGKKKEPEETIKTNTNENIIKDQQMEIFEFTNTSLIYEEETTKLETTVTNTSEEIAYLSEFKIHVKDENETEIIELIGFVREEL